MEPWVVLLVLLVFISLTYIGKIMEEKLIKPHLTEMEGFENEVPGAYPESKGLIRWLDNKELYDSFYCGIYDQLTQGSVRTQAEVGLALNEWTKKGEDIKTFEVLDAGCGTGIATVSLAKMNVKRVVGLDNSKAMLNQAKTKTLPQTTLTEEQSDKINWKHADLIDPSACVGGEYTHALMLYFTLY
jgi:2-polyprenyl-3-methyl-5-hydroxy-6-metoxy-1,4-benzoquinol methylase